MKVKYVGVGGSYSDYPCYIDERGKLYFDENDGRGGLNLYTGAFWEDAEEHSEILGEPDTKITEEIEPEQWGVKGDGITNDCQAFTHMFAQIKTGKIVFRENATYSLGMTYEGDTVSSFKKSLSRKYLVTHIINMSLFLKCLIPLK